MTVPPAPLLFEVVGYVGSVPWAPVINLNEPYLNMLPQVYRVKDMYFCSLSKNPKSNLGVTLEEFEVAISKGQATRFDSGDFWCGHPVDFTSTCIPQEGCWIYLALRGGFTEFMCQGTYLEPIKHRGASLLCLESDALQDLMERKSQQVTPELIKGLTTRELSILKNALPFSEMLAQAYIDRIEDPEHKARVIRVVEAQRKGEGLIFPNRE